MKKNEFIAFILEIVNPALGFTYIDPKNTSYSAVTIIVFFMKILFYFGVYEGFGLTSKGKLVFTLVSNIIMGLPSALVSLNVISKMNKKLDEEYNLRLQRKDKLMKENEINEANKYNSKKFMDDLRKIHNLHKNSLLNDTELRIRKEAILKSIEVYGIKEDPEDFLNSILALKEGNILTKDEILNIRNKVLPL